MLKTIIFILLILVLISLASSLFFSLIGVSLERKRILYGLGFRVTLGAILVLIIYGISTGQLGNEAPWVKEYKQTRINRPTLHQQNANTMMQLQTKMFLVCKVVIAQDLVS